MMEVELMPKRIQLSRARGWRLPEGAVNVARPSRWGNPYRVADFGLDLALELFENTVHGIWTPVPVKCLDDYRSGRANEAHHAFLRRWGHLSPIVEAQDKLRGLDVACWCRLDARCHGDLWLLWANQ